MLTGTPSDSTPICPPLGASGFNDRLLAIAAVESALRLPRSCDTKVLGSSVHEALIGQNGRTEPPTTQLGYSRPDKSPNALRLLDTSGTLLGLAGNDGISAGSGDDLVEGGDGSDLLFGGLGADTLNGGAGDDFIFGSAVGTIDRPTAIGFKPPALTSGRVEAARGFSWLAERAAGERWKDDTASFLGIAISGADASPNFYGPGGAVYVETAGNVIDAGAGNDYVGAGTGADIVHGGEGDDDIYGLNGADVLYGDDGSDDDFSQGLGGDEVLFEAGAVQDVPTLAHGADAPDGGDGKHLVSAGVGQMTSLHQGVVSANDLLVRKAA